MNELKHYGVPGMKWGVRRKKKFLDKEKRRLVADAKNVNIKAAPGKTARVFGKFEYSSGIGSHRYSNTAMHIVDEHGSVKLSYIRGPYGDRYLGAGKNYIDKNINLSEYFRNTKDIKIEYDVYD